MLRHGNADLRRPAGPLFDATWVVGASPRSRSRSCSASTTSCPRGRRAGWLITLALSSQVLGWLLISVSLPRLPAALTSMILTIQPVGSVVLGIVLLGEEPTVLQLAGAACIAGSSPARSAAGVRRCAGARPAWSRSRSSTGPSVFLAARHDLFSRRGIRGVGIDAVIAQSGVARMTLYRHFSSKEQLALAYLERREQEWTRNWLQAEVERRADDGAGRLLAIFDVFDAWFRQDDFEGCAFIHVLLETADARDAVHVASTASLARIRDFWAGSRATPARRIPTTSRASGTS